MYKFLVICVLIFYKQLFAFELFIEIGNVKNKNSVVGCALFDKTIKDSFPTDYEKAVQLNIPGNIENIVCRFENLPSGDYAVSVFNDENNNGQLDTNLFGIPKEDWGVSNNIRHALSSPTFEEAKVTIDNDDLKIRIDLGN